MLPIFTRLHAILASTVLEGDNPAYYMNGSVLRFQYLVFSDSRSVYYLYGLLKPCWEYVLPSHPSGGGGRDDGSHQSHQSLLSLRDPHSTRLEYGRSNQNLL